MSHYQLWIHLRRIPRLSKCKIQLPFSHQTVPFPPSLLSLKFSFFLTYLVQPRLKIFRSRVFVSPQRKWITECCCSHLQAPCTLLVLFVAIANLVVPKIINSHLHNLYPKARQKLLGDSSVRDWYSQPQLCSAHAVHLCSSELCSQSSLNYALSKSKLKIHCILYIHWAHSTHQN